MIGSRSMSTRCHATPALCAFKHRRKAKARPWASTIAPTRSSVEHCKDKESKASLANFQSMRTAYMPPSTQRLVLFVLFFAGGKPEGEAEHIGNSPGPKRRRPT